MFKPGDAVVHPKHGVGVVVSQRTIQYRGSDREYFCIELVGGRGSVMIPVERVEEAGLRHPIQDINLIRQVMGDTPSALVDDTHTRQSGIEEQLGSGNIERLIQALRDLSWRETVQHLSPTDRKLKESALTRILQELASNPMMVMTNVRHSIEDIIQQSMQMHLAKTVNAPVIEDAPVV